MLASGPRASVIGRSAERRRTVGTRNPRVLGGLLPGTTGRSGAVLTSLFIVAASA
jgi:hypothetical protein